MCALLSSPQGKEQRKIVARLTGFFNKHQPQHIFRRDSARQAIFNSDEDDKLYLECLGQATE